MSLVRFRCVFSTLRTRIGPKTRRFAARTSQREKLLKQSSTLDGTSLASDVWGMGSNEELVLPFAEGFSNAARLMSHVVLGKGFNVAVLPSTNACVFHCALTPAAAKLLSTCCSLRR